MAIDVEIRLVAVQALADLVRHPADAQQIGRAVERQAVVKVEALAGFDFVGGSAPGAGLQKSVSFSRKISVAQNTKNITLT